MVGDGPRTYRIKTLAGTKFEAYHYVFHAGRVGEYWGVQGTAWREPPALIKPDKIQQIGKRRLYLYADGSRLRRVGWRTDSGAYRISNTLTKSLSNKEMSVA